MEPYSSNTAQSHEFEGRTAEEDLLMESRKRLEAQWNESPHFDKTHRLQAKDFQIAGVKWLISLYDQGRNGILADEIGLGKIVTLAIFLDFLKSVRRISRPHLIIVPPSILNNWKDQILTWAPSLSVAVLENDPLVENHFDIIVAGFTSVMKHLEWLEKIEWSYLVVDELHRADLLVPIADCLRTEFRLTVISVSPFHAFDSLMTYIDLTLPGVIGQGDRDMDPSEENCDLLRSALRPLVLRRLKKDVGGALPLKVETIIHLGLSIQQLQLYQLVISKGLKPLLKGGPALNMSSVLNTMMQLRKICNHPFSLERPEDLTREQHQIELIRRSGKMVVLDKLLGRLREVGSRVLLFCQMARILDIIEDYANSKGFSYCRIDGLTSFADRTKIAEDFNAPNSPIFLALLSIRAGGIGLNLSTANSVIIFDPDWNHHMEDMAIDRAHRIGNVQSVHVYRFVTENTVEENILYRSLRTKMESNLLSPEPVLESMTADLAMSLVRHGLSDIDEMTSGNIDENESIDSILFRAQQRTTEVIERLATHKRATDADPGPSPPKA